MDVRIDRKRGQPERLSHDDLGGLATDPRQLGQLFEAGGDPLPVHVAEPLGQAPQRLGFLRSQAHFTDQLTDGLHLETSHRCRVGPRGKQPGRHLIDLLVGGLRRKNDGHQQLEGVRVVERDRRVRVQLFEDLENSGGLLGFPHRPGSNTFAPRTLIAVALLFLAGCATTKTAYDVPVNNPGELAKNWQLPHRVIEGFTGTSITEEELAAKLEQARIVYVAERHDRPPDHAVQLWALHVVHQQNPSVGLGIEMLPRPFQPQLDAYVAGTLDEADFLEAVDWPKTWGFDFGLYRPLFQYARDHGLPIYALNARSELTRAVSRDGLENLEPALAADLPQLDLQDQEHRTFIRAAFGLADDDGGTPHEGFDFEKFYQAQVVWDETMADTASRVLASEGGPDRLVVIAGSGHIERRFGVPERAARRGASPYATILPVVLEELPDGLAPLIQESAADFIWLMSTRPERLPSGTIATEDGSARR